MFRKKYLLTLSEHGHNKITAFTGFGTHSKYSGSIPNTSFRAQNFDTPSS